MACPYPARGRDLGSPNLRPMPFLSAGGILAQFLHCAAFNIQGLTSKPWEFGLVQSQYGGMMRGRHFCRSSSSFPGKYLCHRRCKTTVNAVVKLAVVQIYVGGYDVAVPHDAEGSRKVIQFAGAQLEVVMREIPSCATVNQ